MASIFAPFYRRSKKITDLPARRSKLGFESSLDPNPGLFPIRAEQKPPLNEVVNPSRTTFSFMMFLTVFPSPWDCKTWEQKPGCLIYSEPSASYLLSKWTMNEWMQPLYHWPICSVVLSKFTVRLGGFVLFWWLHWPMTVQLKCWFYSRNTWAHILSRSEELPQTLFSSLFLSPFLQLNHWLRHRHEEIKFLSAQESHTSRPVTGRPPWSYLSFPASQWKEKGRMIFIKMFHPWVSFFLDDSNSSLQTGKVSSPPFSDVIVTLQVCDWSWEQHFSTQHYWQLGPDESLLWGWVLCVTGL